MFDIHLNFKLACLTIFLSLGIKDSYAQKQPNIVIIISDDHSYQTISAYGSKLVKTPNIDRISNEGVTFKKAYVTNSICGPSRAVILTGKYSHKNGFKDNETSEFNYKQDMFVKHLTADGYQTAWIGKQHLGDKTAGFTYYNILPDQGDYYNPEFIKMDGSREKTDGYVTNIIEDKAEKWLDNRDESKPFCLIIGHKATHRTWIPDTCDFGLYDNVKQQVCKKWKLAEI
jgi:arylsulfatase A-like enzyme